MPHVVPKEVSAKIVLIKDREVLVRTFIDPKTTIKIYDLPGGRVDNGEQPDEAARREAMEELGARVGDLHLVHAEFVGSPDSPTLGLFYLSSDFEIVSYPQSDKDEVEGKIESLKLEEAMELLSFDVCRKALVMSQARL